MRSRSSLSTFMAFFVGTPLGLGLLLAIQKFDLPFDPEINEKIVEYTKHPVEQAEVVMFCCALGALIGKILSNFKERVALWRRVLTTWDGQPHPVSTARPLQDKLNQQPGFVQNTYLGRRIRAILEFVESRGTANELDDHIRTVADSDALALEGSYALLRFITWAIPILGFLGTVLGITGAIQNVSPEALENEGIKGVTAGLATAFNATALALSLTMLLMFLSYLVERMEQSVLDRVDHFVDVQLAHRFERTGAESGQYVELLRQNTQILVRAVEQLVDRQATVWARSLEKADEHWSEAGTRQQERIIGTLETGLERTLASHALSLAESEKKLGSRTQEAFSAVVDRAQAIFEGLSGLASVLRETGRQHQATLSELAEKIGGQTQALTKLQEGEVQLLRLQEVIQQNLTTLTNTGAFDQAVHSLTAAIHLLTTRVPASGQGGSSAPPAAMPRLSNRAA